jgi:DNA-binding Lrp family transcriptional regulator
LETEMPKAFVLINVESGSEEEVLEQIKKSEGVEEAYYSYGVYDIIAKIEAETMERLREAVSQKMRTISKVRSTLTLIIMEE